MNKNDIHSIVNKLYSTLPIVPTGGVIQNIYQDIQYGLYNECGDPNKNWDKWKNRCRELLKQRNILCNNSRLKKVANKKLAKHDGFCRSNAVIYVNGEFYESNSKDMITHSELLQQYLNDNNLSKETNMNYFREDMEKELKENKSIEDIKFACMHKINKYDYDDLLEQYLDFFDQDEKYFENHTNAHVEENAIFIEEETLCNVSLPYLLVKIREKYPNYTIYKDDEDLEPLDFGSYVKLAKPKQKIKRQAYHDGYCRTKAILFIDGDFYEEGTDTTHSELLQGYLAKNNIEKQTKDMDVGRDDLENEMKNNDSLDDVQFACLHEIDKDNYEDLLTYYIDYFYGEEYLERYPNEHVADNAIFIETETLRNINLNDLAKLVKNKYPNHTVYEDDECYAPLDFKSYKRLARKKVAYHDVDSRTSALVFLNGEIFEGETHNSALSKYFDSIRRRRKYNKDSELREVFEYEINDLENIDQVACLNMDNDNIFIEMETLKGISLDQLISILKSKYPNCLIYEESDRFLDAEDHVRLAHKKIANNRKFTWEEIYNETVNSGGKMYCEPLGSDIYFRDEFELKLVNTDLISGYMTYEEYEEYDLDEDCSIVEYLTDKYDDGVDFPPIILDKHLKIIDGSHRMSMYENLGIYKIKAYVQVE